MDARPRCQATKADGTPCQAAALPGRDTCLFHSPDRKATCAAGRKAGGRTSRRVTAVLPKDAPDLPLATMADVRAMLAAAINLTLKGRLDPRVSNAAGYLAAALVRAIQGDELAKWVEALEAAANWMQTTHGYHRGGNGRR